MRISIMEHDEHLSSSSRTSVYDEVVYRVGESHRVNFQEYLNVHNLIILLSAPRTEQLHPSSLRESIEFSRYVDTNKAGQAIVYVWP